MNLLRCATHTVRDVDAAAARFVHWLDYHIVENGVVSDDLAQSWGTPASAGRRYCVCQPASKAEVFVRFIEGDPVDGYLPIHSYGWVAIEICVQDVLAVNARMLESPFEVIGPPTRIAGLPTIFPMQVRGRDQETMYFTEITTDATDSGLPKAESFIDKLFILVLACADMNANVRWFQEALQLDISPPVAIRYSMIAKAFNLPVEQLHEIVTAKWGQDIFLEFDQYPPQAVLRPSHEGALPPGISICTLLHPAFHNLNVDWFTPPEMRSGALYGGRLVGVLRSPEGALIEVIDGA